MQRPIGPMQRIWNITLSLALAATSCSHGFVGEREGADGSGDTFSAGLDIGDATHGGSEDFGINTDGTATMHDATALDLGVPRDLAGEAWPDTNACVPNGQTEICDGEADDDCDGLPDDKDPDCTCSDGILSGQETDRDCGGPECPPCSHGSACTRDSDCDASSLLVCRGDEPKRCAIPASCLQIKNLRADLSTGPYVIECSLGAPMLVRCDMETDGGGWTEITLSAARVALNGQLVAVESAAKAGFDTQHRPYTLDADGAHTYHYSFDFPCGFSEFFLLNFAARSALATEGAGSSEINVSSFVQRTWNQGYFLTIAEPAAGVGDISFGAGTRAVRSPASPSWARQRSATTVSSRGRAERPSLGRQAGAPSFASVGARQERRPRGGSPGSRARSCSAERRSSPCYWHEGLRSALRSVRRAGRREKAAQSFATNGPAMKKKRPLEQGAGGAALRCGNPRSCLRRLRPALRRSARMR
jgi:hypothetical protein